MSVSTEKETSGVSLVAGSWRGIKRSGAVCPSDPGAPLAHRGTELGRVVGVFIVTGVDVHADSIARSGSVSKRDGSDIRFFMVR